MSVFHRQDRCFHNRWFVKWMLRHLSKKLQMNTAQQQQLVQLQSTMHSVCSDVQSSREDSFHDVESLLKSEKLDRAAVLTIVLSPKQVLAERLADVVDGFGDLYDTLSTEQRVRLLQLWQSENHCWQ